MFSVRLAFPFSFLNLVTLLYGAQMIHSELEFVPYMGRPSCVFIDPLLQIYFDPMFLGKGGCSMFTHTLDRKSRNFAPSRLVHSTYI